MDLMQQYGSVPRVFHSGGMPLSDFSTESPLTFMKRMVVFALTWVRLTGAVI